MHKLTLKEIFIFFKIHWNLSDSGAVIFVSIIDNNKKNQLVTPPS